MAKNAWSPWLRSGLVLLPMVLCAAPQAALAGDFMDTRITFLMQDDDFLHGAGETLPNSPSFGFGRRDGRVFFFENHNRKDRGDETLTHLVSYKKMEGFIPRLTTEAALVLRFDVEQIYEGNFAASRGGVRDEGTYINLRYDLDEAASRKLELTLFPFSTERFQLGYSYRMAWGGSRIFGTSKKGPAPGVKLTYQTGASYLFLGAKTATIQRYAAEDEPLINDEMDTFYAGLMGAGYEPLDTLLLEINGGFFQRGTNPKGGVRGEPVNAWGTSVQLTYHQGMPVRRSADFGLYRNDPNRMPAPPEDAEKRPMGFSAATEFTWLQHILEDPEHYGATEVQTALAGDLNLVFQNKGWLFYADGVYRDLAFVLFNQPSFTPYQAFSSEVDASPELWGAIGVEYTLSDLHMTPGLTLGVQMPAAIKAVAPAGSNAPDDVSGERTVVVRGEGDLSILPPGEEATPIFGAKGRLRWDLSPMLSVIGEVFISVDNNRTLLKDDVVGISTREFVDPVLFGGALLAQARF